MKDILLKISNSSLAYTKTLIDDNCAPFSSCVSGTEV